MLQTPLVAYLMAFSASSLQIQTLSFGAARCRVKNTRLLRHPELERHVTRAGCL